MVSMTAAVAQWTPNAVAFGPPLRKTIVPSAIGDCRGGEHQVPELPVCAIDQ